MTKKRKGTRDKHYKMKDGKMTPVKKTAKKKTAKKKPAKQKMAIVRYGFTGIRLQAPDRKRKRFA